MTKRLTVLIFILLNNFFNASGQRIITGRVIDNNTKKGVKEANVKLANKDTTVVTNFLGFFQIKADTSDNLLISASNYEFGKYKVPTVNNFSVLLIPKKEEVYVIVEEPSHPLSFESFKKYLSKGFNYSANKKSGELIVDFVTDTKGSFKDVTILENSFDEQCENSLINLLTNAPKWEPALQRKILVKQEHRIKIVIHNDKIENTIMMPPNLNSHNMLTMHLMQNLNLPKRFTENSDLFEIYICFEHNKSTKSMNSIKVINCKNIELENELLRVIKRIPYQLIYDLYPESTNLIQPLLLFFNSDAPREKIELPEGELQKDIIIEYRKGENER